MPKPRRSGGKRSIRPSSSQMPPPVSGSSPARQLSAVDLPQPEGPSRAMNSPRLTSSDTSFSALSAPKSRLTRSSRSFRNLRADAITAPSPLLRLRSADLLVPAAEGVDQLIRQQRQLLRIFRDEFLVLGPAVLL